MRALLFALCWLVLGPGARADVAAPADSAEASRQILLMLRMPSPHFRAGSDYAGSWGDPLSHGARRRVAAQLAGAYRLQLTGDWPMPVLGVECFVMSLRPERASERGQTLVELGQDPRVAWAQPMNVYRAQAHDDPLYAVQPAMSEWHLSQLHEFATGAGVRVAVVDSGIELSHPDLAGQVELSENFVAARPLVAERHGTEVAGIIAARADNHLGIVGVAPQAHLMALRACWQDSTTSTLCTSLSLSLALDFAIAHSAQVINLSLAGPSDPLLGRLLEQAARRRITVVAAVDREMPGGGFPASHPGVIAVAETGAPLAASGTVVSLAPGQDVPTTGPPSRWYMVSGSSYAAAHVSGLVALLRQLLPPGAPALSSQDLSRLPSGAIDACATLMHHTLPRVCGSAVSPVAVAAAAVR